MLKTIRAHHNVKTYFKEFAERAEIVYFGVVGKDDDAHIYKGVTFSPNCIDTNYCHGTVNGYDLTTFQRESQHKDHESEELVTKWTVVALHLKMGGFPHILLDGRKHDKTFYNSIYTRFPRLRRAGTLLAQLNQSANNYFDLYMRPESNAAVHQIFDDMLLQRLIISFSRYNVEIHEDMLYVYAKGSPVSTKELMNMLSETLWLAETIENRAHNVSPAVSVQV